jgi:hypothetical protein
MKDSRWFDSKLSINPDSAMPARFAQASPSTKFRTLVLATSGVAVLTLAVIACSKEANKPVVETRIITPAPAAPSLPAAEPAPVVASSVTPDAKPVAKKTAKKRPTKVVYKNGTYGISFQYPRRYALKTGDEAIIDWFGSQPVGTNFVDRGGVGVAAVELPRGMYPGTDYRDAFFTVSVNRNLSQAQCSQFAVVDQSDSDEEPIAPTNTSFGGQVYSETETFDGKAFEQAYAHFYHVYNNGACYEMALGVETAGYGVVEGITPVDRDEVFHKLEDMLASVRLQSEERVPETAVATLTPNPAPASVPSATPAATAATATPAAQVEGAH